MCVFLCGFSMWDGCITRIRDAQNGKVRCVMHITSRFSVANFNLSHCAWNSGLTLKLWLFQLSGGNSQSVWWRRRPNFFTWIFDWNKMKWMLLHKRHGIISSSKYLNFTITSQYHVSLSGIPLRRIMWVPMPVSFRTKIFADLPHKYTAIWKKWNPVD